MVDFCSKRQRNGGLNHVLMVTVGLPNLHEDIEPLDQTQTTLNLISLKIHPTLAHG